MKAPTVARCVKAFGLPTEEWKGKCFQLASKMVKVGLVQGEPVYGHWRGPVLKGTHFYKRSAPLFVPHGWVLLPDGRICDPTRWVFYGSAPFIFLGENNGQYDEGGNRFRESVFGQPPPYELEDKQFVIPKSVMDSKTWRFVEVLLDIQIEQVPGVLSWHQLCWLANCSPRTLGEHLGGVYEALVKLDHLSLMPIDNQRYYERTMAT
jgi:hypothetical protein